MSYRKLFFLCALLVAQQSYSQPGNNPMQQVFSIRGTVTDSRTGEPLASTTVYITDLKRGVVCDTLGRYALLNIPPGSYLVEVSHLGYSSVVSTVVLNANIEKDFALIPSILENENVTVTGVSSATSTKRTPIPVNILKKEDLFRNISTNLIDNISHTPGVTQVSTGPAVSKPFIRGLGYNRVLVIHDGLKQEGQQWGDEHGVEVDEQNVGRVEILKGPASLVYGSDALAGVINIISILPPPDGNTRGNLSASYFTNNRQRNFHGDIGGNHNGIIWGFNGSYKAAADYKNAADGYVFNSKFNEKDFGAYGGINKTWGFSHLYVSNFSQVLGLVEGDRDPVSGKFLKLVNIGGVETEEIATDADFKSTDPYIPRQKIGHFRIASDNSFRIGKNRLTAVLGYQNNIRKEFGNILDPEEEELFFDLGTVNYNIQYHMAERNNFKTTIGVNGMRQTSANKGEEALIPEYSLFDIGLFIYTQKRISKLTLSGGVRGDTRSLDSKELMDGPMIKFPAFKKTFSNISGSAGLSYEASKSVTLKFNLARGFRAPVVAELGSNGAHEGTDRFEYGEQNLNSETSLQADGGIEIGSEHVSFNASIFYNSVQDFIYYRKLESVSGGDSLIINGTETFFAYRFTQDNAKLYGIEFNLDFHPHPLDWLHVENTFSWVRGRLDVERDGSRNLPFIPAGRLINEIKVEFLKSGKRFRNLFIKAELDNTFSQDNPFTGFNTENATPAYSLLNAAIGVEWKKGRRTIANVFFGANNITDKIYQNHLSRLKYAPENMATGRMGVFNMGRNFSIKLNVPFEL
jgi:iron complex outermembrane recepter protein